MSKNRVSVRLEDQDRHIVSVALEDGETIELGEIDARSDPIIIKGSGDHLQQNEFSLGIQEALNKPEGIKKIADTMVPEMRALIHHALLVANGQEIGQVLNEISLEHENIKIRDAGEIGFDPEGEEKFREGHQSITVDVKDHRIGLSITGQFTAEKDQKGMLDQVKAGVGYNLNAYDSVSDMLDKNAASLPVGIHGDQKGLAYLAIASVIGLVSYASKAASAGTLDYALMDNVLSQFEETCDKAVRICERASFESNNAINEPSTNDDGPSLSDQAFEWALELRDELSGLAGEKEDVIKTQVNHIILDRIDERFPGCFGTDNQSHIQQAVEAFVTGELADNKDGSSQNIYNNKLSPLCREFREKTMPLFKNMKALVEASASSYGTSIEKPEIKQSKFAASLRG